MAAILNYVGCATGLAVAKTVGQDMLIPEAVSYDVVIAGLASIILWGTIATLRGLPISLHHGFIAGLTGAAIALFGTRAIVWIVMRPILIAVVVAPAAGFVGGFITMTAIYWLFRRATMARVRRLFSPLQILSSAFVAYTHGLNDGQMPIAVIVMALVIYSGKADLWTRVPFWVIVVSALSISFGTAVGGWRCMRTVGIDLTRLDPVQGFAAEASTAAVVEIASLVGMPVSTTHCICASIMGVGATRRLSAVRWGVAANVFIAWIITFPLCGGLGYLLAWLVKLVFR
jgi:PiT family inorganic phosphate transporter